MKTISTLFGALFLLLNTAHSAELIVVEQDGCVYCELFNEQIAEAYPKTSEGKLAPLRRIDLHEPWPKELSQVKPARFTPTFILVENDKEVDRINGYPGDEHFWFLVGEMLSQLETQPNTKKP